LQSVINYRLKFSGIVVTVIGRECGPVNPKISAWAVRFKNKWTPKHFTEPWSATTARGLSVVAFGPVEAN
jgi:hypothetical protein